MHNLAGLLVLLFLAITFLQSGYDKFTDYQGNLGWLKEHFAQTFLNGKVDFALKILLVFELIAGLLCVVGSVEMCVNGDTTFGKYGAVVSCITLLMLLFGQRIAKDYDGARTIAIYFITAVFGVFLLQ
ncbi:DoxX family membrane protein [Flavobacterium sp. GCM10027622]|uniref:DoxX family membrane protein n=1 Tax=unclassified Flavobacterium TaxID=196869 RepID=UPI00360B3CD9